MFTTVKHRFARIVLAASVILILASTSIIPVAYAAPVCATAVTGC